MFRIVCDPSSGSTELCLTEITLSCSQIFFMCLVGVWQRNFEPVVCVHGTMGCSPFTSFMPVRIDNKPLVNGQYSFILLNVLAHL